MPMTTPTNPEHNGLPRAGYLRHETSDGTVFWGDIPQEKFERATASFPILKYVIEEYFGSPERPTRDTEFLERYEAIGEESAEFSGFLDDLTAAIKKYSLAASLVNGLMGTTMTNGEVRTHLTMLKDQILQQGDFDPQAEDANDPFLVNSAEDRIKASFLWKREIPIGPLKGKAYPVIYYFLAGVLVVLIGLGISYIPYIGTFGVLLMFIGGIICFIVAVGMLSMRNEQLHPEKAQEREAKIAELEKEKAERNKAKKGGLLQRINPFKN